MTDQESRPMTGEEVFNLALEHHAHGRWEEAKRLYELLLTAFPGDPQLLKNLGYLELARENHIEAREKLELALNASPGSVEIMLNLGATYLHLREDKKALEILKKAEQLAPEEEEIQSNLGEAYQRLKRFTEAEFHLRKALKFSAPQSPNYHAIAYNLALVLEKTQRSDEAAGLIIQAWKAEPTNMRYATAAFGQFAKQCDFDGMDATSRIMLNLKTNPKLIEGCTLNAHYHPAFTGKELRSIAEEAVKHGSMHVKKIPTNKTRTKTTHSRIRIGYILADVRNHANGYNTVLLFGHHDRSRFEIFVYSTGPNDHGWVRHQVERDAEHFIDLHGLDDYSIASRIHTDQIDIIVDLMGHTAMSSLGALAYRPAPIQVTWLGYPGTTGADFIDYIIGDPVVTPDELANCFTEKILRLPNVYQLNNLQTHTLAPPPPRSQLGLPEDKFIFCCFCNQNKITRERFASWMTILKSCPHAILWLFTSNEIAKSNLRREAARHGVTQDQVIFTPSRSRQEYLEALQDADLFLDTSPYGAHTTASDALWAGIPILTTLGTTFPSRVTASILSTMELGQLIVSDEASYINKAIELAHEPAQIESIKRHIRDTKNTSPLFDARRLVRDLEDIYLKTFESRATA